jgi:hypothetical protein
VRWIDLAVCPPRPARLVELHHGHGWDVLHEATDYSRGLHARLGVAVDHVRQEQWSDEPLAECLECRQGGGGEPLAEQATGELGPLLE